MGPNKFKVYGLLYSEDFGRQSVVEGEESFAGWTLVWAPPYHDIEPNDDAEDEKPEPVAPVVKARKPTRRRRKTSEK